MRKVTAVLVLVAVLSGSMVAGCAGPGPRPPLVPSPSATPLFASDEEALAAAEAAYGEYLEVLDESLRTFDVSKLSHVASQDALQGAIDAVLEFQEKGTRLVGHSLIDTSSLAAPSSMNEVSIYSCLDLSGTDVVNEAGDSTLPSSRTDRYPMEVRLVREPSSLRLLVYLEDVWTGGNFCE